MSDTIKCFALEALKTRTVSEGTGDHSESGQIDANVARLKDHDLGDQIDGHHYAEDQSEPEIVVTDSTQTEDTEYCRN